MARTAVAAGLAVVVATEATLGTAAAVPPERTALLPERPPINVPVRNAVPTSADAAAAGERMVYAVDDGAG